MRFNKISFFKHVLLYFFLLDNKTFSLHIFRKSTLCRQVFTLFRIVYSALKKKQPKKFLQLSLWTNLSLINKFQLKYSVKSFPDFFFYVFKVFNNLFQMRGSFSMYKNTATKYLNCRSYNYLQCCRIVLRLLNLSSVCTKNEGRLEGMSRKLIAERKRG